MKYCLSLILSLSSVGTVWAGGHCAAGLTLEDDTLTIATGNPAYYPWVLNDAPESGEGFEAAIAYAIAEEMGFDAEAVAWVRTSFDEAIQRANDTRYGLSGGLVSDDDALWIRAHAEMRAGILNRNRPTAGASGAMPFGGPGLSGNFRPGAYYAADYCAWPQASQASDQATRLGAVGFPK